MGWLGKLLKGVAVEKPQDLIFVDNLPLPGLDTRPAIVEDQHYVELYVESMRIEKSRSFATRFHGVVYSFATLAREGEENAVVPAISKPREIAELDANSVGKVITVSRQMMGAVPWRGGVFGLELGLFSVKSGNVLTPIVNFVTKVSEAAGISFVGAVKPFVPLITEGMDLIAGQAADVKLQVGVDTSINLEHPMACAIIAADRNSVDISKLTVDASKRLLLNNAPLDHGYCLFSIRSSTQKADFGQIPELKEKYADLRAAAKGDDRKAADDALAAFRRAAYLSPDLIRSDAQRLVALAQQHVDDAFPTAGPDINLKGPGAKIKGLGEPEFPKTLADVSLYAA